MTKKKKSLVLKGYFCWARDYGLMLVNPMAETIEPTNEWLKRDQLKQALGKFSTIDKVKLTMEEL